MRAAQFPDFVSVLTAFLQNLIGNILNFNTIYQNIVNANNAGKLSDVYFYLGRLSYLILYFDPLIDQPLYGMSHNPMMEPSKYLLNQNFKAATKGEPATIISIIYDLPTTFLNASIGISSPNSSICIGNISGLNSSVQLIITQF